MATSPLSEQHTRAFGSCDPRERTNSVIESVRLDVRCRTWGRGRRRDWWRQRATSYSACARGVVGRAKVGLVCRSTLCGGALFCAVELGCVCLLACAHGPTGARRGPARSGATGSARRPGSVRARSWTGQRSCGQPAGRADRGAGAEPARAARDGARARGRAPSAGRDLGDPYHRQAGDRGRRPRARPGAGARARERARARGSLRARRSCRAGGALCAQGVAGGRGAGKPAQGADPGGTTAAARNTRPSRQRRRGSSPSPSLLRARRCAGWPRSAPWPERTVRVEADTTRCPRARVIKVHGSSLDYEVLSGCAQTFRPRSPSPSFHSIAPRRTSGQR